ncbi:MAG: capsular polysaccharide transport system permease protein [Paraglaciecola sp.]|jgi:capsular polysaccharide transport system permease protein
MLPNNPSAEKSPATKVSQRSSLNRKVDKLKRDPVQFVSDSKAFISTQQAVLLTRAKLGSFALVLVASLIVIIYYTLLASPRYVSEAQFIIKQSGSSSLALTGLAAFAATSPATKDALIVKEYMQSRVMALALDKAINLKTHYQQNTWDWFSRLNANASTEEYVAYYQQHITVKYDDLSEILAIEVQSYRADYALNMAQQLVKISETFINRLGDKMVQQQLQYAQKEVDRAHQLLTQQKNKVLDFQNKFELYNPKQQGVALVEAINQLGSEIINQETQLKSLLAYMKKDSADVKAQQITLNALNAQLNQEKQRLTNTDQQALNKLNMEFQEVNLTANLATDLYQAALAAMEQARTEAYRNLKHVLIIAEPSLAQENKYPRRLYSIFTWFITLILIYAIGKLIISIIKEHQE